MNKDGSQLIQRTSSCRYHVLVWMVTNTIILRVLIWGSNWHTIVYKLLVESPFLFVWNETSQTTIDTKLVRVVPVKVWWLYCSELHLHPSLLVLPKGLGHVQPRSYGDNSSRSGDRTDPTQEPKTNDKYKDLWCWNLRLRKIIGSSDVIVVRSRKTISHRRE